MKNNKTFTKSRELNGSPYLPSELKCEALRQALARERKKGQPEIWLTDSAETAQRLSAQGACCLYLLTSRNRHVFSKGIKWCAEVPENLSDRSELSGWLSEDFLWQVWLRERGLPWHICETDRLVLREMMETDLDFLYEMQADAEAAKFLDALDPDRDVQRQKVRAYCKQMYDFYGFGIWIILEKKSGKPVGRAGLQMRDGVEGPELGFAILKKYRGKGYAEEACRATLVYAERVLEIYRVRAVVDEQNRASRRVCEKLGFIVDNTVEMEGGQWIVYKWEQSEKILDEMWE